MRPAQAGLADDCPQMALLMSHIPWSIMMSYVIPFTREFSCRQGMDMYSNILYVKEQFAALSHLAHRVAAADKYRPETCCIIGNYYSLKGQHEKVGLQGMASVDALGAPLLVTA